MATLFGLVGSASATLTYTCSVAAVPEASTYGSIGAVAIVGFLGYSRARRTAATKA